MSLTAIDESWLKQRCCQQEAQIGQGNLLGRKLLKARISRVFSEYGAMLEAKLNNRLNVDVQLRCFRVLAEVGNSNACLAFKQHGCVAVRLRVYDGHVLLLLEAPALRHIAVSLTRQANSGSMQICSEQELVALSFVCADILADREGFAEQRAYLSDLRYYASDCGNGSEPSAYLDLLMEQINDNQAAMMQLVLRLQSRSYAAALVFCPKVVRRIAHHARFYRPTVQPRSLNGKYPSSCTARISIPAMCAETLLVSNVGDRIELAADLRTLRIQVFAKEQQRSVGGLELSGRLAAITEQGLLKIGVS